MEEDLQRELEAVRARLAALEALVRQLAEAQADYSVTETPLAPPSAPLSREQVLLYLKARKVIVDPPANVDAHVGRWDTLSEETKKEILWELDHLPPGPLVSDIVQESRR